MIEQIIKWNEIVGNKNYNKHLEASMLGEEFSELIIALKNGDKVEAVDAVLDTFWVGIGTLWKLGLSGEQINKCFEAISESNYSKFTDGKCIRDETGKILKPDTFKKPNLESIIK